MTLHFPRSIEALKNLSNTLQHYRENHLAYLLLLYCSAYLYKQAFSLPGSVILVFPLELPPSRTIFNIVLFFLQNLLGGALFGTWLGFPLCCLLTATGALFCYLIVANFARKLVVQYCHKRIILLQKKVKAICERTCISVILSYSLGRSWSR